MDNLKFSCDYSCKHFFGCTTTYARNKAQAKKAVELKLKSNHSAYHSSISDDCGGKCKLKITNLKQK